MQSQSSHRDGLTASNRLTAEEIAHGIGARRIGRNRWRGRCLVHGHRSLEISESGDGKPLVHCFGGCTQAEVIAALRDRGLWNAGGGRKQSVPRFTWIDHVSSQPEPQFPDCCLAGRCPRAHWDAFDVELITARLTGYLVDAAVRIAALSAIELHAKLCEWVERNPEKIIVDKYLNAEQVHAVVWRVVEGQTW